MILPALPASVRYRIASTQKFDTSGRLIYHRQCVTRQVVMMLPDLSTHPYTTILELKKCAESLRRGGIRVSTSWLLVECWNGAVTDIQPVINYQRARISLVHGGHQYRMTRLSWPW